MKLSLPLRPIEVVEARQQLDVLAHQLLDSCIERHGLREVARLIGVQAPNLCRLRRERTQVSDAILKKLELLVY